MQVRLGEVVLAALCANANETSKTIAATNGARGVHVPVSDRQARVFLDYLLGVVGVRLPSCVRRACSGVLVEHGGPTEVDWGLGDALTGGIQCEGELP